MSTGIGGANLLSVSQAPGMWSFPVGDTMVCVFSSLVPLSIAVAILCSGLWDIDVLINRALVYGSLTILLAALYFALVLGAQALVLGAQALTGRRSLPAYVVVASTLLIATLFQPLRAYPGDHRPPLLPAQVRRGTHARSLRR